MNNDANNLALATRTQAQIHDHLCNFYHDPNEGLAEAITFIKAGLTLRDYCIYIVHDNTVDKALAAIEEAGIDVKAALGRGQLMVATKHESYMAEPYFDPEATVGLFIDRANIARRKGFRGLRGIAEMSWQLDGDPGADRLIEYEAKLADFFPHNLAVGGCQYNLSRFPAVTIRDALFTHPKVMIDGITHTNPYYRPDEEDFSQEQAPFDIKQMLQVIAGSHTHQSAL